MSASNQLFLVVDAGSLVVAFTARDAFTNPLVYTFWGTQARPEIYFRNDRLQRPYILLMLTHPSASADDMVMMDAWLS